MSINTSSIYRHHRLPFQMTISAISSWVNGIGYEGISFSFPVNLYNFPILTNKITSLKNPIMMRMKSVSQKRIKKRITISTMNQVFQYNVRRSTSAIHCAFYVFLSNSFA
jgi:hypothetical protein